MLCTAGYLARAYNINRVSVFKMLCIRVRSNIKIVMLCTGEYLVRAYSRNPVSVLRCIVVNVDVI